MADERWEQVKSIVGRALELEGAARSAFIDEACEGDDELRAEVFELVSQGAEAGGFLRDASAPDEEAQPDALAGRKLGEFELVTRLGTGGMAVVYLAYDRELDREVAVKVLVESPITPARHLERFHREARAAARLRHPGIVPVFAEGTSDELHWFAMELVPGHDLGREIRLQRARQRETEACYLPRRHSPERLSAIARLCAEVADALQHAHEHGLVHRDIKPQNLLLDPEGRVQIADFGLARDESLGSLTRTGELAGTPHYMSPEQAHVTQAEVSSLTDVYSLGVVLYELCALRRPFDGRTSAEILSKIERFDPPPLRRLEHSVPRELETICATAMAKEPERRYPDAAALAADLRRWLAGEPIVARPPSLAERTGRFVRRRRLEVTAATVLVAGLALGIWWKTREVRPELHALVSVRASDEAGRPLPGHVWLRPVDPMTGVRSEAETLGELPIDDLALEPGFARIVVDLGELGKRELSRHLPQGRTIELEVVARSTPDTRGNMVRIAGGELELHEDMPLSPVDGRRLRVDAFWIDATEVSNADYRRFLESTGHEPPMHWSRVEPALHADLPVVNVGWVDAQAYAEWARKRLPSFLEWSFAARGAEGRIYPWEGARRGELRGNVLHPRIRTDSNQEGVTLYFQAASGVATHPDARTPEGLYHMLGNVCEWTESPFSVRDVGQIQPDFDQRLVAGNAWDAGQRGKGGRTLANCLFEGKERSFGKPYLGFRCALSEQP